MSHFDVLTCLLGDVYLDHKMCEQQVILVLRQFKEMRASGVPVSDEGERDVKEILEKTRKALRRLERQIQRSLDESI